MAILSITEAIKRVGVARGTMYRHIKNGKLSKSSGGGVDESELLRVYKTFKAPETPSDTHSDKNSTHGDSLIETRGDKKETLRDREVELLMEMIEMLKTQLSNANNKIERLEKRDDQWMAIFQNRLPAPMSETLAGVKNKVKSFFD
ncbi:MAG: hypothetical protein ABGX68_08715 [Methylococcales bacterium]|jgi:hypothetical protein